jgi:hypothetical protein
VWEIVVDIDFSSRANMAVQIISSVVDSCDTDHGGTMQAGLDRYLPLNLALVVLSVWYVRAG